MNSRQHLRRRVRLGDDGLVHVRTRSYRDELLTKQWEELVMTPAEALDFFRSGMDDVLRMCPDTATRRAGAGRSA